MKATHRHYYAASSYMGLNFTYDSPCWALYAFNSQAERDDYVNDSVEPCMAVTIDTARKICPWLRKNNPEADQTGYYTFNHGRRVIHL